MRNDGSHYCSSQQSPLSDKTAVLSSISRREFLWNWGGGLGGIALAHLLTRTAPGKSHPEFNGGLHHHAKAKRVVQLFMSGAASQVDTFDYKPEVIKRSGEKFDPGKKVELFQSRTGPSHEKPLGLEAARTMWQMGKQSGTPTSKSGRRNCLFSLDDFQIECPWPRYVHAEHRPMCFQDFRAWGPGFRTGWAA